MPNTPPRPIRVSELEAYAAAQQPPPNGNGHGFWKAIASGATGLLMGFIVAWFTALQGKGVTRSELQDYVDKYSPYVQQKEIIASQQQSQDKEIGKLIGEKDRIFDRLNVHEGRISEHDLELKRLQDEVKTKMDIVATMLEAQKRPKP